MKAKRRSELAKGEHRFWQFHLSTAVFLVFAAAGLSWANVSAHQMQPWPDILPQHHFAVFGWPLGAYIDPSPALEQGLPMCSGFSQRYNQTRYGWNFRHLAIDIVIAVTILIAAGFLFDQLIRRRKGASVVPQSC